MTSTAETIRAFRVGQFEDLGFRRSEAKVLADSKGADGHPLDIHSVKKVLKDGATHIQAYRIFNDPPVDDDE